MPAGASDASRLRTAFAATAFAAIACCRHRMLPHIRSAPVFKLQTGNFTLEFPSLPADFGKPIPPEGLTGLLLLAQPEDACSQLKPPRKSGAPWIALIARSQEKDGCTFDIKVRDVGSGGRCSRT